MYRLIQIIVLAAICAMAQAQSTSDSIKVINLVFGGSPGGKDITLRPITAQIEKNNVGVRFNYEFKPGAGELIAYNYVSKLNHQSNTVFLTTVNLFTYLDIWNLRDISIRPMDMTFGPIIAQSPSSIVTASNSMIYSLDDFITQLKSNSNNIGGTFTTKLYHEYILDKLGIDRNKLQFIPYKSGGDGALAAASGQVHFANVPLFASYRLHQSGKLKIIAIAGTNRLEKLPGVPLLHDVVPGANFSQATILVLPPGTTAEQLKFYQDLFTPALNDSDVRKALDELLTSVTPQLNDPVAARAYVQRLRDKWQPYARRIQPE